MYNKRGQGLSTNAIILIILGVIILAVLVIGFTVGWSKIAPFISRNNVDTIQNQCETACSTQSVYGFCSSIREVRAEELEEPVEATCYQLSTNSTYAMLGISECPELASECESILENMQSAEENE